MNLNRWIEDFRNDSNPVLYLGAGISRSAPSSIPLFSELMEIFFRCIDSCGGGVLERFAGQEAAALRKKICELPIDEFFADLKFLFGDAILKTLSWMDTRPPNQAHMLLAEMAKDINIRTILTPNFDCLLEKKLPIYKSIEDLKVYSDPHWGTKHANMPSYLDPAIPAIFHLHGTTLGKRLEITPAATAMAFDHFDHANISTRLQGGTILVAGCSGKWDLDVVELLKLCNIRRGIWIVHASQQLPEQTEFPIEWKHAFQEHIAIRGDTTKLLSLFAKRTFLAQEPDNELTELQEIVGSHLSSYDDAWREYGVAILLNKIFCGDISLLILKELDKVNPIKKLIDSESEKIMKVIDLLPQVDSVELADGRMLPGERYASELQEKADIVKRFIERKWPIIIGRAKAIAVSRNRRRSQETDESVKSIMNEVIANLQAVIPPERCNSPRLKNLTPIWREWMLAYESMGIFALENHNCKLAIEYLDQARQFCTDPEDDFRLQRTRISARLGLDLEDVLSDDEVKLIKELLPDDNSDLPRR